MTISFANGSKASVHYNFNDKLLLSSLLFIVLPEGQCPVAPSERQECGYFGITKQQCLDRYCCWDDSVQNAKWCFKEPGEYHYFHNYAPTNQCSLCEFEETVPSIKLMCLHMKIGVFIEY